MSDPSKPSSEAAAPQRKSMLGPMLLVVALAVIFAISVFMYFNHREALQQASMARNISNSIASFQLLKERREATGMYIAGMSVSGVLLLGALFMAWRVSTHNRTAMLDGKT